MAVYLIQQPEDRRRLYAYLKYGLTEQAAREAGCSRRTLHRTWQRLRPLLPDFFTAAEEALKKSS